VGKLDAEPILEFEDQFEHHQGVNTEIGQQRFRNNYCRLNVLSGIEKIAYQFNGFHTAQILPDRPPRPQGFPTPFGLSKMCVSFVQVIAITDGVFTRTLLVPSDC
jgi:hypothetical protein